MCSNVPPYNFQEANDDIASEKNLPVSDLNSGPLDQTEKC